MPTDSAPNPTSTGCLLVLGMHRSGTSAVTGTLARLGVSVGDPSGLHPADPGNPSGYWEPLELIEINDALLASWGGSQRDPQLARRPLSTHALPPELVERMSEYARRWDTRTPFVWKDPRLCITLPLWRPLLPIRGFVLAARHPAAVADSLGARDSMNRQAGLVLWEAYVRSLLAALDDTPRVVIRYEELFEDREGVVGRLAEFAERTIGGLSGDRNAALRGIERRSPVAVDERASTPTQQALYKRLCEGSAAPDSLADPEVVALLDAATRVGAELTRLTFFHRAAEEKIERIQAKAALVARKRAEPTRWKRLRNWARRLRARR